MSCPFFLINDKIIFGVNIGVRALWLAAGWVGVQWLIGIAGAASGYNIAIAAHIGGFFAGLLLAKPLLRRRFSNSAV